MGTVGGLALLTGGTAIGSVAGSHSVLTTAALALLAMGMAHALRDETRRQAHRGSADGWATEDSVNAVLLSVWAVAALLVAVLPLAPPLVRGVGGVLATGYAVVCVSFVHGRRRTVAAGPPAAAAAPPATDAALP